MPVTVSPPLARAAELLLCPHCGDPLAAGTGVLVCPRGHSHDVAREGYVTLLTGPVGRDAGDDAAMVAARVEIERAGHFAPLAAAMVDAAAAAFPRETLSPGAASGAAPRTILDLGAGTGRHLATVLDAFPQALGVAVDVSVPASRRAARAHPRLAAVRADTWARIPLGDAAVDLAVVVFAPRNGEELARVVGAGGTLLVATPAPDHLRELREHHSLSVHPDKAEELRRRLGPAFEEIGEQAIEWMLALSPAEAGQVLRMGPTARHLDAGTLERLASSSETTRVSAAVELRAFRRR